jgi:hypothetical protein
MVRCDDMMAKFPSNRSLISSSTSISLACSDGHRLNVSLAS